MVTIALCDDDPSCLRQLCSFMEQYSEQSHPIEYKAFLSPLELLNELEHGRQFDIYLLDILTPGQNGIETAAEIRTLDQSAKIIFLSSSPDFAVQSYSVNAYFYLLKPLLQDAFFRLLDSVLATCETEKSNSLILRCRTGITRVDYKQLEYCEVSHRTLFLHLTNGTVLESAGRLDDLTQQLAPFGNFLRPHRSYLVNLDHVQSLSFRSITMASFTEIPIPRGKYNEIKNIFLEYAFQNKQVTL